MKKRIGVSVILMLMGTVSFALGAETTNTRAEKKAGLTVGFMAPSVSIIGINANYNFTDRFRFTAGTGSFIFGTTLGIGGSYIPFPEDALSPMIGLEFDSISISSLDFDTSSSGGLLLKIGPGGPPITMLNLRLGVDWQLASGFNLQAGIVLPAYLSQGGDSEGRFKFLPFLSAGWFF